MNKEKKIRKQLTITKKAFDCATKAASNTNRSFNNYIETLILNDCQIIERHDMSNLISINPDKNPFHKGWEKK